MNQFLEFVDRKQRDAAKHLKLIEKLLRSNGITVGSHLEDKDPYIFVKIPSNKLSFDGIRIYEVGDMIAYRVQKEERTHPYGKAYQLNLEEMFNDYMSENEMKEEEAGQHVIESVVRELKKFFVESEKAEADLQASGETDNNLMLKSGLTTFG